MMIAIPAPHWRFFRNLSDRDFANALHELPPEMGRRRTPSLILPEDPGPEELAQFSLQLISCMIYRPLVNLDHFVVNRWLKPLALNPANRLCDR